jgi:hypothetical protein
MLLQNTIVLAFIFFLLINIPCFATPHVCEVREAQTTLKNLGYKPGVRPVTS